MGNTFGSNGLSTVSSRKCLVIEEAQVVLHKTNEPDFIADLVDSHVLAGENGAEVDLPFAEADTATAGDRDGAVVKRVLEFAKAVIAVALIGKHELAFVIGTPQIVG